MVNAFKISEYFFDFGQGGLSYKSLKEKVFISFIKCTFLF